MSVILGSRSVTISFKNAELNPAFIEQLDNLNKIAELLPVCSTEELLEIKREFTSNPNILSLVEHELKQRS